MPERAPLVLTLELDARSQARFDQLRAAHFPPERNHLAAHVTLFHALPGDRLDVIAAGVAAEAAGQDRFEVEVRAVRSLGRGVAYDLAAAPLAAMRSRMAQTWADLLTRQDAAGFRPHVTVQNMVDPVTARELLAALRADFEPWSGTAEGLALWWYRGGPWQRVEAFPFQRS